MADQSRKTWGYILEAPGRPSLDAQQNAMRALGVDMGEFGTLWRDKIARGSTRPRHQLSGRNDLLGAVVAGDTVVIAAPFCLGLSASDAAWFLEQLAERRCTVVVNGNLERIEPGQPTEALVEEVARRQNVLHSTRSQRKKREQG